MERNQSRNGTPKPSTTSHRTTTHIPLEILDDLAVRFIINFPHKDHTRICFQLELAHWFYCDEYVLDETSSNYDLRKCEMKEFFKHMFRHIPFLKPHSGDEELGQIYADWKKYKLSVPTYGAIMLNEDLTHVVLASSYWNKKSWGFPKGKVNEEEAADRCAVREVYEETGYSIAEKIDPNMYITKTINDQECGLFLIHGVPMNTKFKPIAKFEISEIDWFPLDLLPSSKNDPIPPELGMSYNSLFMAMPFVKDIRKWVAREKRQHSHRRDSHIRLSTQSTTPNPQRQKAKARVSETLSQPNAEQQVAPYGSMEYMPKAWMNFKVDKKAFYQALDSVLLTQ